MFHVKAASPLLRLRTRQRAMTAAISSRVADRPSHRVFSAAAAPSDSLYGGLMVRAPLTVSGLTALVLWGTGDILAQTLEQYTAKPSSATDREASNESNNLKKDIELNRFAGCLAHGFFIGGVGGYAWYGWLDHFVTHTARLAPGTKKFIAAKMFLEVCVWHPVCLLGFWTIVGTAEGHGSHQIASELKESFLPTFVGDASLWTPIDILNFRYVPVHLQALVINCGSLVEAVFLSYVHGLGGGNHAGGVHDDARLSEASTVASVRRPKFLDDLLACRDQLYEVLSKGKTQFELLDPTGRGYLGLAKLEEIATSNLASNDQVPLMMPGITNAALSGKVLGIATRMAVWNQRTQQEQQQMAAAEGTAAGFGETADDTTVAAGAATETVLESWLNWLFHRDASVVDADLHDAPPGESGISAQEYFRLLQELHTGGYREARIVSAIFKMFDVNHDGQMERGELAGLIFVCTNVIPSEAELDAIFKEFDANGDGAITPAEFQAYVDRHVPRKNQPEAGEVGAWVFHRVVRNSSLLDWVTSGGGPLK